VTDAKVGAPPHGRKFGEAGKLMKEFGPVNAIDCRNENVLYVGELTNWRVRKLTLRAVQ